MPLFFEDQAMSIIDYKKAGVDIEAGDELVERIKPLAKKTMRSEVLGQLGGFGALFALKKYDQPILVSGTDGVGTKLKLAFAADKHDTIGIDLVAMCVNDILAQGAEPLFFLDYFATGHLHVDKASEVISGIAEGCKQAGAALIGGETAEMPSMYPEGEYDLAGFAVGVVEKNELIDGKTITEGDSIIGLASSGAHSNGYSLIRKLVEISGIDLQSPFDQGKSLQEILLTPTRIYVKNILVLKQQVKIKGIAHITGGGISENLPRIFPPGTNALIHKKNWPMHKLFHWLQKTGNLSENELFRTFNCGLGLCLVVDKNDTDQTLSVLQSLGEKAYLIGTMKNSQDKPRIHFVG